MITGDYQPLTDCFKAMHVRQLVLEYCTPRAGELAVTGRALADREIGLGCVNPRTDEAESPESIVARATEALQFWRPEQIFLNPDCGFATSLIFQTPTFRIAFRFQISNLNFYPPVSLHASNVLRCTFTTLLTSSV